MLSHNHADHFDRRARDLLPTFGHYREPIVALAQRAAAKGLTGLQLPREGDFEILKSK